MGAHVEVVPLSTQGQVQWVETNWRNASTISRVADGLSCWRQLLLSFLAWGTGRNALKRKNAETFAQLRRQRPQEHVRELPHSHGVPARMSVEFGQEELRGSPSGVASGPGGCTNEMVRLKLHKISPEDRFPLLCATVGCWPRDSTVEE